MTDNEGKGISSAYSAIYIDHSLIARSAQGAEFRFSNTEIRKSWFFEIPGNTTNLVDDDNDGIYYWENGDYSRQHILDNCVIYMVKDDCLDLLKNELIITNCILSEADEKGISAGYGSKVTIDRSSFVRNAIGISPSFGSHIDVFHSNIYKCSKAVLGYEYSSVHLHNSILVDHSTEYNSENLPTIFFNHCLSNKDNQLPGTGNVFGSAGFKDAAAWDFRLTSSSPAIDAGDPEIRLDPDGSNPDIGVFAYGSSVVSDLVITEIHYHPSESQGPEELFEFIEIVSLADHTLDISNYRVTEGIDFTFPIGTDIHPGEYLVIAADPYAYSTQGTRVFGWENGRLSNSGEVIKLVSSDGELLDQVSYSDASPWPLLPDGQGYSLSLKDPYLDNSLPANWTSSYLPGGTPGVMNLQPDFNKLSINEILVNRERSESGESVVTAWVELYYSGSFKVNTAGLFFTNDAAIPDKWRVLDNNIQETWLETNGYQLFSFNEVAGINPFSIPMSLLESGNVIILFRRSEQGFEEIDRIQWSASEEGVSTGSYPNGSGQTRSFPHPSPGSPNALGAKHIMSLNTVVLGDPLPIVVKINPIEGLETNQVHGAYNLVANGGTITKSAIQMVRGRGSVTTTVSSDQNFKLEFQEINDSWEVNVQKSRLKKACWHTANFSQIWTSETDVVIPQDFTIPVGRSVTIMPGTRVLIGKDVSIQVEGALNIHGSSSNPVVFMPLEAGTEWGGISYNNSANQGNLSYCFFIGGGGDSNESVGHASSQPVVYTDGASLHMNNCYFIDNEGQAVYSTDSYLLLEEVFISRCDAGIESRNGSMFLSDSDILYLPDEAQIDDAADEHDGLYISKSTDADGSTAEVSRSFFAYITDDGLDILSKSQVNLSSTAFYRIKDKAVSVIESKLYGDHLLIEKCDEGLVTREAGYAYIDQSTLYRNTTATRSYTNNENVGHGHLFISNSIFSASETADRNVESGSAISVEWSLTDGNAISGTGNITGNPLFSNPVLGDFSLQPASPAIDAGDPEHAPDPDGSRVDMGAFPRQSFGYGTIIINEIHYQPTNTYNTYEFVELYNTSQGVADISGYQIGGDVQYTFPVGTIISGNTYILIAQQAIIYQGRGFNVYQWNSGTLNDGGGSVQIINKEGLVIDQVDFMVGGPWPSLPAGSGPSLELVGIDENNSLPASWRSSHFVNGSPGLPNVKGNADGLRMNEVLARNTSVYPDETGEFSDWLELYNPTNRFIDVAGLFLTNDATVPDKHTIPEGYGDVTYIAPGGFKTLWLDDNPSKGPLHVGFIIPGAGSFLGISSRNGNQYNYWDQMTYPPIGADVSYGRVPDGGSEFMVFDSPTPNAPNQGPRDLVKGLYINELLARNESVYRNNLGEFDDWIELYNSSDQPINVGGLYITDDAANLLKWQIPNMRPDSTTIPAKGFLLLFPTTKTRAGVLHTNFQLAGGGEYVGVVQFFNDEPKILDEVNYPAISTNRSYGRVQDASSDWIIFTVPTPKASNHGASSAEFIDADLHSFAIYPNPASDFLVIGWPSSLEAPETVRILNLLGQVLIEQPLNDKGNSLYGQTSVQLSLEAIKEPGIYLVSVSSRYSVHFQRVMILNQQ